MESFSQRKGIKPVKTKIQRESMDNELRTWLWNVLYKSYFANEYNSESIIFSILVRYFKYTLDEAENFLNETFEICYGNPIRYIKAFFSTFKWNEVYDFTEFVPKVCNSERTNQQFRKDCNDILESNLSAYHFVGDKIVEIASEEEIAEIESALQTPISPIKEHLNRALVLFADRTNPDYRNSIKESISAVESLCKLITGNAKATLGDALKEIDKLNVGLHPALKDAFSKLYGYTNDADGIRHGLTDEPNLYSEDARFMLVACSAFINYLSEKASKAGINLQ
jgi:hypothetical protein